MFVRVLPDGVAFSLKGDVYIFQNCVLLLDRAVMITIASSPLYISLSLVMWLPWQLSHDSSSKQTQDSPTNQHWSCSHMTRVTWLETMAHSRGRGCECQKIQYSHSISHTLFPKTNQRNFNPNSLILTCISVLWLVTFASPESSRGSLHEATIPVYQISHVFGWCVRWTGNNEGLRRSRDLQLEQALGAVLRHTCVYGLHLVKVSHVCHLKRIKRERIKTVAGGGRLQSWSNVGPIT